jgi:peptidylprolyl isomerase
VRRTVPVLIVIAALAGAALTGCSGSSGATAACSVTSGNGSDSIRATGGFGKDPKAKVPSPLNVTRTESTTLIKGDGPVVEEGSAAELSVTVFDGASGASQPTQSGFFPIVASQLSKGLTRALACAREGSRIAVVIPQKDGADLFNAPGSVVAIVDVTKSLPSRATGAARPATPGFPTVVLAPSGQPGIVLGGHSEPKTVRSAVLRQGDGAVAKKSDTLVVQTQTVNWSDPSSATGTWEKGAPAAQGLSDGSVISTQLIGQKVGSQLIVLTPKSKSTDGQASATVVDILGVLPASAQ